MVYKRIKDVHAMNNEGNKLVRRTFVNLWSTDQTLTVLTKSIEILTWHIGLQSFNIKNIAIWKKDESRDLIYKTDNKSPDLWQF
jgi:hypothetical protein